MDVRQLPLEKGEAEVRLRAGRPVAAGGAACLRAARRRLFRQFRLSRRTGDDQSPLLALLHRAAVDQGEGLRGAGVLCAGAGERGEVPGDRAQRADPDRGRHRPGAGCHPGAQAGQGVQRQAQGGDGRDREGVRGGKRALALRRGRPLPRRPVQPLQVQAVPGRAPGLRAGDGHRLLRRRSRQLQFSPLRPRRLLPPRLGGRQAGPHRALLPMVVRGRQGRRSHVRLRPSGRHRPRADDGAAPVPAGRRAAGAAGRPGAVSRRSHHVHAAVRRASPHRGERALQHREQLQGDQGPLRGAGHAHALEPEGGP